jgi:hypothetical protein
MGVWLSARPAAKRICKFRVASASVWFGWLNYTQYVL